MISITQLITGCESTRVEYWCPELFWKDFPELITGYDDDSNNVYMDLNEFEKLYQFKNWYEAQKDYYFRVKELYEGINDDSRVHK